MKKYSNTYLNNQWLLERKYFNGIHCPCCNDILHSSLPKKVQCEKCNFVIELVLHINNFSIFMDIEKFKFDYDYTNNKSYLFKYEPSEMYYNAEINYDLIDLKSMVDKIGLIEFYS